MKKIFFIIILFSLNSLFTYAQSILVNTAQTPSQLVNNVLLGFGVTASNITINGSPVNANTPVSNITSFTNNNPAFPFSAGMLLTTGNGVGAQGPNNSTSSTNNNPPTTNVSTDPELNALAAGTVTNGTVLEFDFIPSGDTMSFRYIFGSEEYPEFSPSSFNDAFGLFLWGPGISGPYAQTGYPAGGANIAVIPGAIPVTINNVGDASNTAYYVFNDNGSTYGTAIQYDGTTVVLTAAASVQCNQTYHIKLAISNVGDQSFDSGVFLEAGSFASDAVAVTVATVSGDTTIIEGCTDANFIFTRPSTQLDDTLIINYTITGDAVEGVDYNDLINPITFLPGEDSVILNLTPTQDGITEGFESVIITVEIINPCNDTIFSSGTIYIGEGPIINISENDPLVKCATDSIPLFASASGGYAPYDYEWTTLSGSPAGTGDTISGSISQNGTVSYLVTATDNCDFSGTDTVTITMNQTLAIDTMGTEPSSCQPTGVVWGLAAGTTGIPSFNWTGPGSNNTNFIDASVWEDIPSGWYYFTVTDDVCSVNDSVYVDLLDPPIAEFTATPLSGCSPLEVTITNNSQNGTVYLWNLGDGTINTTTDLSGFTHIFENPTQNEGFTIQLIVQQGPFCSDTAVAGIITTVCGCTNAEADNYNPNATVDDGSCIFPNPVIEAPNVFTPNQDGLNEVFELEWKNLKSLRLIVLNRWGNVVYDETSEDLINTVPSWDGGKAEEGVYFYKFQGVGITGQELEGHGFIHLVRSEN
ncbi:MAG: choice-of-anchor L domain-containing protein [Crocinitomicaceae bacterium]